MMTLAPARCTLRGLSGLHHTRRKALILVAAAEDRAYCILQTRLVVRTSVHRNNDKSIVFPKSFTWSVSTTIQFGFSKECFPDSHFVW
jgi:hypothetical protein